MIVYVISGYGLANPNFVTNLTGGIFTHSLSIYLHTTLDLPILVLLMVHVLIEMKFGLIRWGIKDGILLNTFLVILGTFSSVLLIFMDKSILMR
jgi:hypothetical protein